MEKAPEYDIIVTAECKSIPLIYEMARQNGDDNYIVARKAPKVYMENVIYTDVNSITTANAQKLCLGDSDIEAVRGKRVLIVDDVISTGESLDALVNLVTKAGGNIVGKMAILLEGDDLKNDSSITYLEHLPLFNEDGTPKQ